MAPDFTNVAVSCPAVTRTTCCHRPTPCFFCRPLCRSKARLAKHVHAPKCISFAAETAVRHYLLAPLYMQPPLTLGISGKAAAAATAATPAQAMKARLDAYTTAVEAAAAPFLAAGKLLSYTAVQEWWKPRQEAWRADPSKVVTEESVLEFLRSEAAWAQPPADWYKVKAT